MGLFSSKTKIEVHSMSMKLVADTPNYIQQSVLTSIQLERPIVEDLNANMIRSLGVKLTTFYKYGQKHYHYGLPEGSVILHSAQASTVGLVIAKELGKDVHIHTCVYDSPIARFWVEEFLLKERGWIQSTGEITNAPFSEGKVHLNSVSFRHSNTVRIEYIDELLQKYVELKPISPIFLESKYYHARYSLIDAEGNVEDEIKYWFYPEISHMYEVLNEVADEPSKYYPVVPLRHNKVDLTEPDDSDRYQTSRQALRKLGLDIKQLGAGINGNPGIDQIDHAYVIMGVSPKTTSKAGKAYLFEYFNYLHENAAYKEADYKSWSIAQLTGSEPPPANVISIRSPNISYNVDIGFLYITSVIHDGVLGKSIKYASEIKLNTKIETDQYDYTDHALILRKQISETQYEELTVVGLRHIDHIYPNYDITTDLNTISGSEYEEDNFLIPLHHDVVEKLGMLVKLELAYDAMRIDFHSITKTEIKWYQTGFFKLAVMVAAIAITICSAGSLSAVLTGAAKLVGATSLIVGAVVLATINISIQYGVAFLVDKLGMEFGALMAVAATVMAFYGMSTPNAPVWLSSVQSGIFSGIDTAKMRTIMGVQAELAEMEKQFESETDKMNEWMEDYSTAGLVDPLAIHDSMTGLALPWESPEQYYNTRIHTGNMAPLSYVVVENFVSSQLQLEGVTTHYGL